jgi:signal transduction histidine kinase
VGRIEHVSKALGDVVSGVQDVSTRLRGIATSSAEQSTGLTEMSASVANLDQITQQNAHMVEESALASQELAARAGQLRNAVASIRLRQGSADEALALVERAQQLIATVGVDAAFRQMREKGSGFVDRDMYVFAVDRDGTYRVHAANPGMEGRRIHEVAGIDGVQFTRDAWQLTERGAAWVEYEILNLDAGVVQPKTSYMERVNDRLVMGCGVYGRAAGRIVPPAASEAAPRSAIAAGLRLARA